MTPPNPLPTITKKTALYKNSDIFEDIDRNALEVAKKEQKSFTELIRKLCYKCKDDLEIIRSFYVWMCTKDSNIIEKLKMNNYNNLLKRLCSYAGINCAIIDGYSKGLRYLPGTSIQDVKYRNQWTAVWLNNSWRFINCKWGASYYKRSSNINFNNELSEFYFLTDPEDYIQQHFPDNKEWQLLSQQINISKFEENPMVTDYFLMYGLSFPKGIRSIMPTNAYGNAEIEILLPKYRIFDCYCKLIDIKNDDTQTVLPNRTMNRYIGNKMIILVNVQEIGDFYLKVYFRFNNSRNYIFACMLKISCSSLPRDQTKTIHLYPEFVTFGSTSASCKILDNYKCDPFIILTTAEKSLPPLTFSGLLSYKFKYWRESDMKYLDYDKFAMLEYRSIEESVDIYVRCPQKGIYILAIYKEDESKNSNNILLFRFLFYQTSTYNNCHILPQTLVARGNCYLIKTNDW